MPEFINTADVIGDDEMCDRLIMRTLTEYKENRITKLGAGALGGCTALTVLEIPEVTTVENDSLQNISVEVLNLPKVTVIGSYACRSATSVKVLNAPEVVSIDHHAFVESGLVSLNCPKLKTVGVQALAVCYLKEVGLQALTTITRGTFYQCAELTTVDAVVANVVAAESFLRCSALSTLILRSETVARLNNIDAFGNTPISSGTGYIYVPRALLEDYKVATNWSTYANQFRAIEDYTVDGTITGELDESKL